MLIKKKKRFFLKISIKIYHIKSGEKKFLYIFNHI
jgi:hypothetical protein